MHYGHGITTMEVEVNGCSWKDMLLGKSSENRRRGPSPEEVSLFSGLWRGCEEDGCWPVDVLFPEIVGSESEPKSLCLEVLGLPEAPLDPEASGRGGLEVQLDTGGGGLKVQLDTGGGGLEVQLDTGGGGLDVQPDTVDSVAGEHEEAGLELPLFVHPPLVVQERSAVVVADCSDGCVDEVLQRSWCLLIQNLVKEAEKILTKAKELGVVSEADDIKLVERMIELKIRDLKWWLETGGAGGMQAGP